MFKKLKIILAACCVFSIAGVLSAQTKAPEWLDDQTVCVVRIDMKDSNLPKVLSQMVELLPSAANELNVWRSQLQAIADSIQAAGGEELLVIYSLADDFADQPLWVVPKAKKLDILPFQNSFPGAQALSLDRRRMSLKSAELLDSTIVGTTAAIQRITANKTQPSPALLDVLASPRPAITLLVTMSADQRRATSEMLPQVPPLLGGGQTRELLSQVQWLRLDLFGQSPADLVVTAAGDTAAVESRLKSIKGWLGSADNANSAHVSKMLGKFFLEQLTAQPPKAQGQTITWKIPVEAALKSGGSDLLSAAMLEADEKSAQYQLRTLALAIHNHHSAMGRLPSPLCGLDGKSPRKLSWRVDLLPFMDQNDLYQQFHLDEAWDSPHNRSLIPKMPSVFRVPQSKHATQSGMSTFVLPSNAVTMWPADRATDFKDIEDGSSNTIMIVEVKDDFAQEWTKPDPFEINMQNPAAQLGGHFIDKVLFAAGDGSTGSIQKDKLGSLPALLTRSGGEVIAW